MHILNSCRQALDALDTCCRGAPLPAVTVACCSPQLEARPAAKDSSSSGTTFSAPTGLFGGSTGALRSAEAKIEQLTAENAVLRDTAERRAKTIMQSKQVCPPPHADAWMFADHHPLASFLSNLSD